MQACTMKTGLVFVCVTQEKLLFLYMWHACIKKLVEQVEKIISDVGMAGWK